MRYTTEVKQSWKQTNFKTFLVSKCLSITFLGSAGFVSSAQTLPGCILPTFCPGRILTRMEGLLSKETVKLRLWESDTKLG